MHLFYTPDLTRAALYALAPEESRHAVGVLRLRPGDEVRLTDVV